MNAQSVTYTADGSTTVFAFTFPVFEPQDMDVLLNTVVQTTGYTILGGEGANSGGAVRFDTAPASGQTVILRRTGKVQVSGTDAPGFLEAKVLAGANISVSKTTDANGEHLVIAADANPADFLLKAQNLADLPNATTARSNLGLAAVAASGSYTDLSNKPVLGSAAAHSATDFATAAQGAKADSALQSSDIGVSVQAHGANLDWLAANLSTAGRALIDDADAAAQRATLGLASVAASGSYNDLIDKPVLGSAAALNVGTAANQIVQLDASAKLPAVDGSQLTNIPVGKVQTDGTDTAAYLEDKLQAGANVTVVKSAGKMVIAAPNALDKTQNLADLANAATARSNLGLASVAASGSYADLSNKPALGSAAVLNVDTDTTLAANSDALVASEKAVKAYVDTKVSAVLSSPNFTPVEQDLAQTYLLAAMAGGWTAGQLPNGAYDAFNSDTIGANSTNSVYSAAAYINPGSLTSNLCTGGAPIYSSQEATTYFAPNAFDGSTATLWGPVSFGPTPTNSYIGYDFGSGAAKHIRRISVTGPTQHTMANIAIEYSDDNATWTLLQTIAMVDSASQQTFDLLPSGSHRYWRLRGLDTNPYGGSVYRWMIEEIAMMAEVNPADMTLLSNALNPAPASAPSQVKLIVLWKDLSGSAVLNTDFTAEASRDGSTWTAGTLTDTGYSANGYKVLWAVADVSAQPSSTVVKYRLKALNSKFHQVKGVALMVK